MSETTEKTGVESLIDAVIHDKDSKWRPFCECCVADTDLIRERLSAYDPATGTLPDCKDVCECCSKFKWACDRAYATAKATNLDWKDILSAWEHDRNYWYMNYYQDSNQPDLSEDNVFVFDTLDDFKAAVGSDGFTCPKCQRVSKSPYECTQTDCDWKAYGLFKCMGRGAHVFVRSEMRGETIFMPVAFANSEKKENAS